MNWKKLEEKTIQTIRTYVHSNLCPRPNLGLVRLGWVECGLGFWQFRAVKTDYGIGIGQGDKDARFLKVDKSNKSVWVSADGISPNVTQRYDLNTVLARVRWGATISKMMTYKMEQLSIDKWEGQRLILHSYWLWLCVYICASQ